MQNEVNPINPAPLTGHGPVPVPDPDPAPDPAPPYSPPSPPPPALPALLAPGQEPMDRIHTSIIYSTSWCPLTGILLDKIL